MYGIYINIAMPYSSFFPSWELQTVFLRRLTSAFLTGYSLSTLVALIVIPVSCRLIAFKEITTFLQLTRKSLKQQAIYIHKLKSLGILDDHASVSNSKHTSLSTETPQVNELADDIWTTGDITNTLTQLGALHSKLGPDIGYAKREVAFGSITGTDLEEITERLHELYLLVTGMGQIVTMLRRLVRPQRLEAAPSPGSSTGKEHKEKDIADAMNILDTTFNDFADIIDGSIDHTLLLLELNGPTRRERLDIRKQFSTSIGNTEAYSGESSPGQSQYLGGLERRVAAFQKLRMTSLEAWKASTGFDQGEITFNFASQFPIMPSTDEKVTRSRSKQELLLLLWVS
jgi:hypothetical protein